MPEIRSEAATRAAAGRLRGLSVVAAVDVVDQPDHVRVVEIVLRPGVERAPPRVLRALAEHDYGLQDVTPRGEPSHLVLEAV